MGDAYENRRQPEEEVLLLRRRTAEFEQANEQLRERMAAMEKELTECRQRYQALIENLNDIIYTTDCHGNVLTINCAVRRILGLDPQEVIGTHCSRWIPQKRSECLEQTFRDVLSGRCVTSELVLADRDGRLHYFETSLGPLVVEGRVVGMQGIVRDITSRREAERMARQNEDMLRALFDSVRESILLVDCEGTVLTLNETAARRLGKTVAEMRGARMEDVGEETLPRSLARERMRRIEEVVRTGRAVRFEDERAGMCFDVSAYPIPDENGAVRRIALFAKDVTERKRLEQKLRDSEEKYRTVVESAVDAILIVDEQGVFHFMNGTAARMLGGRPSDFIGETMWELFPSEYAHRQMDAVQKVIRTATGMNSVAPSRVGGRMRWYNTTIEPLRDSTGTVTTTLVIARDIHELRAAQQELEAYRERMMRAEQLAALGTLSATFAHELTQPLTVIQLSLQNAIDGLDGVHCPATVLEDLNDGLAEMPNITAMVERFRSFARRTSERAISRVVLSATADRVMRLLEESARKARIALEVAPLDDLPAIHTHEKDMEQIFFSLAQNAIQAADGLRDRRFRIAGTHRDSHVELRFTDDCGGIAPDHLDHVFKPFFTTKRDGQGTGLGLCVVHRMVSEAGGHIRVDSRFGEGTTFIVTLPVKREG